jgi:DNA-binding beta-propeller fold protein YncE
MQNVKEVRRRPSPATRPQPLAFHNERLWMGSWDTDKLYAIDPRRWSVVEEIAAPGKPYGIASFQGNLAVVVALGDDDRYLYRCSPGRGFDPESKTACPDFTGSHLAADGSTLYLCQQGRQRILALDASGAIQREIALPTRCAGFGFGPADATFMISGDAELENLTLAGIDLRESTPAATPLAAIPFDARSLAFDGAAWWTSHREASEIVAFAA